MHYELHVIESDTETFVTKFSELYTRLTQKGKAHNSDEVMIYVPPIPGGTPRYPPCPVSSSVK